MIEPSPRIAYLLVTGRCNLACDGCYATLELAGRHTKQGELTLEQYSRLVRQLWEIGVRVFDISGGEPMLRLDLVEICTAIRALPDTRIWLVSNGTLVRGDLLMRLGPLVERLAISLDAADAALHDRLRGRPGAFDRSLAALRQAQGAGFAQRAINFLLCRDNPDELAGMLDLAAREAVELLAVLSYRDVSENAARPEAIPPLPVLLAGWATIADRLQDEAFPRVVEVVVPAFLHGHARRFWQGLPAALRDRIAFRHPNLRGQGAFRGAVVVKPLGGITGDTAMANADLFEVGSVAHPDADLATLWSCGVEAWQRRLGERERTLRAQGPCRDCSSWNVCRGGCPAAALRQSGTIEQHDRACDAFRVAGVI
jgi:radical SAM protein with 4Fe4S-binding SPASM domain